MLIYRNLDIDKIDLAIRDAIIRDRGVTYNHTVHVVRMIIAPLFGRGKFDFNLTRSELMNMGIPQRTAANVIKLLLKSGVIVDTGDTIKIGDYRPMKIYKVGDGFFTSKRPTNYDELEQACAQAGQQPAVISLIRSQMEKERKAKERITTEMLINRFEELMSRTESRQNRSYYFSKKAGI